MEEAEERKGTSNPMMMRMTMEDGARGRMTTRTMMRMRRRGEEAEDKRGKQGASASIR